MTMEPRTMLTSARRRLTTARSRSVDRAKQALAAAAAAQGALEHSHAMRRFMIANIEASALGCVAAALDVIAPKEIP